LTDTQQSTSPDQPPKDLIGFLDFYLVKKAPFQLPDAAKEAIVQYGPWITIVLLVLTLPILLAILGIGAIFSPLGGVGAAAGFGIVAIGTLVQIGLTIAALPGLFARTMGGWTMLFYARVVAVVTSLLALNILGAIVGGLISFYILFQIRPLYKS
jgi:hypothetical protein